MQIRVCAHTTRTCRHGGQFLPSFLPYCCYSSRLTADSAVGDLDENLPHFGLNDGPLAFDAQRAFVLVEYHSRGDFGNGEACHLW